MRIQRGYEPLHVSSNCVALRRPDHQDQLLYTSKWQRWLFASPMYPLIPVAPIGTRFCSHHTPRSGIRAVLQHVSAADFGEVQIGPKQGGISPLHRPLHCCMLYPSAAAIYVPSFSFMCSRTPCYFVLPKWPCFLAPTLVLVVPSRAGDELAAHTPRHCTVE